MSAIGHYIHFSKKGYEEHGTTRSGAFNDPNISYQRQKQMLQQQIEEIFNVEQKELQNIAEIIEAFKKDLTKVKNLSEATAIINNLNKTFEETLKKGILDFEKGFFTGQDTQGIGRISAHRTKEAKTLFLDLQEIVNKVEKLENVMKNTLEKEDPSLTEIAGLKEKYEKLLNSSTKEINNKMKKNGIKIHQGKIIGSYKDIGELRDKLNGLIETYAPYSPIIGLEGELFEDVVAFALKEGSNYAEEHIDTFIKKTVKGTSTKLVEQYDKEVFDKKYTKNLGSNSFLEATIPQRSKVDIAITWNDIPLKISAKNIIFHNNKMIETVTSSPLLYMIQDMDTVFVNHWINLHALFPRGSVKRKDIDDKMKLFLFYKSLTGDTFGRDSDLVNLFIVNDKITGKVIVKNIKDIIEAAEQNLQAIKMQLNGKNIKEISKLKNKWHKEGPEARIATILHQLHELKVNAGFNASTLL